MSSAIDQYEDMVELKSEGDRHQVQLESDLPHKSRGIIWFYYMPCDVEFDRYISAAHVFLEF